jgi:tetratricopeptide (TPR) repeat protein
MPVPKTKAASLSATLREMTDKASTKLLSPFELQRYKSLANELKQYAPNYGLCALARYELFIGNIKRTWELTEEILALNKEKDSRIIANCAMLATCLEKYNDAIKLYTKAIEISPGEPSYLKAIIHATILSSDKEMFKFWHEKYKKLTSKFIDTGVMFSIMKNYSIYMVGNKIEPLQLKWPIHLIVTKDDDEFFAECQEISILYGTGKTEMAAASMLCREINSLYEDLLEDDNFSQEYLDIKKQLIDLVEA